MAPKLNQNPPLRSGRGDPVEPVAQVVFIPMVTHRAEVIVGAIRTLPADAEYRLLAARVADGALVLRTCRGASKRQWLLFASIVTLNQRQRRDNH